jgi:hypothetical protein
LKSQSGSPNGALLPLLHIGTLVYNAVSTISFRKFVAPDEYM